MSDVENLRKNLTADEQELKRRFEEVIGSLEQGNLQESARSARVALDQLREIAGRLKQQYPAVLDQKLSGLEEDNRSLERFLSAQNKDEAMYVDIVARLGQHMTTLSKEIRATYPKAPLLQKLTARMGRKGKLAAAVTAVVLLVILIVNHLNSRKYGLIGEYYEDSKLKKPAWTKLDKEIDFNWEVNGPKGLKKDQFSIRWTGFLNVTNPGIYEFRTYSDDGVRLWIGDNKLIDNWTVHRYKLDTSTIALADGYHPLKLEYFENRHKAAIRLLWKHESQISPKSIPSKNLISDEKYLKN